MKGGFIPLLYQAKERINSTKLDDEPDENLYLKLYQTRGMRMCQDKGGGSL